MTLRRLVSVLLLAAVVLFGAGVVIALVRGSRDAWAGTGGLFCCLVLLMVVRTRMPKG